LSEVDTRFISFVPPMILNVGGIVTARVEPMEKIRVDAKGRVCIPKSLRKGLGLDRGTELEVLEEGGRIILAPLVKDPVEAIFDMLGRALPEGKTATEIQRGLRAEWDQDVEGEASHARGFSK